jgi:hypothetical protein
MVCEEIIVCPVVSRLRGPLSELLLAHCETQERPCARCHLRHQGQDVPALLLPDGSWLETYLLPPNRTGLTHAVGP